MAQSVDVAVVGGGILGLAFAWEAARRGRSVALFERDRTAQGGSIRNFGMVWPIGQTPGRMYHTAMRSRERWLELADEKVLTAQQCGSLHVAHEADEDSVLREFADAAKTNGIQCQYLNKEDVLKSYPHIFEGNLRGAIFSPTELVVDPRQAIAGIPKWLAETHKVQCRFQTAVTAAMNSAIRDTLSVIALLISMLYLDWMMTLVVLAVYPLAAVPILFAVTTGVYGMSADVESRRSTTISAAMTMALTA